LDEKEKEDALNLFKIKIIDQVPEIGCLFEDRKLSEKTIMNVWDENLENYRVPLVISIGEYVYGLAGIYKARHPKYIDNDILTFPYVYKSLLYYFLVRDLFYFINRFYISINGNSYKSIYEEIKNKFVFSNKELKDVYSQFIEHYTKISEKDSINEKERLFLALQFLYVSLSVEEIEELHIFLAENFNKTLLKNTDRLKNWYYRFNEYYDAFYFSYKLDDKKQNVYTKCFIVTKYGVFQDMSYAGKEVKDPVKLLSESIYKNIDEDIKFKIWLEEEIERYKYAQKTEDKIYEYLIETDNLENGEFVRNFSSSRICEILLQNAINKNILYGLGDFENFFRLLKKLHTDDLNKEIYIILMLIYGFEMPSIRIDIKRLLPKNLRNKLEKYLKDTEGAISIKDRKLKIKQCFLNIIRDLEYFLRCINPFLKLYVDYNGDLLKFVKEGRKQIEIKTKSNKEGKKTPGKFIEEFQKIYFQFLEKTAKKKKAVQEKLESINNLRNLLLHVKSPEDYEISEKEFEEICKNLSEIYDDLNKDFSKFHLLKIEKVIEDCHARKYIKAREYNEEEQKDWYITFSTDEIYELIDPTYIYYMVSRTNPVAHNPFILPALIGFEIEYEDSSPKRIIA